MAPSISFFSPNGFFCEPRNDATQSNSNPNLKPKPEEDYCCLLYCCYLGLPGERTTNRTKNLGKVIDQSGVKNHTSSHDVKFISTHIFAMSRASILDRIMKEETAGGGEGGNNAVRDTRYLYYTFIYIPG